MCTIIVQNLNPNVKIFHRWNRQQQIHWHDHFHVRSFPLVYSYSLNVSYIAPSPPRHLQTNSGVSTSPSSTARLPFYRPLPVLLTPVRPQPSKGMAQGAILIDNLTMTSQEPPSFLLLRMLSRSTRVSLAGRSTEILVYLKSLLLNSRL